MANKATPSVKFSVYKTRGMYQINMESEDGSGYRLSGPKFDGYGSGKLLSSTPFLDNHDLVEVLEYAARSIDLRRRKYVRTGKPSDWVAEAENKGAANLAYRLRLIIGQLETKIQEHGQIESGKVPIIIIEDPIKSWTPPRDMQP